MSQPVVLITFYSRCGTTETLALSAGVGAVQGRALIRLRRLPDISAEPTLEQYAACRDTLVRMHREYVSPAEADILGADAIVVAAPPGFSTASAEWQDFFATLSRLSAGGALAGKVAAVVDVGDVATMASFSSRLQDFGFAGLAPEPVSPAPVNATDSAIALGRHAAHAARARKGTAG